ncbi:MAG: PocR ligand-binding domain-containing protein [Desulfobacterales bacterium]|nr:PocR ligand-binding domain-containing protein [Pseudomonadota bacterium]MCG2773711.1 PocR ligand-binding domain-containing protein [Desulfobacterales bacterium]
MQKRSDTQNLQGDLREKIIGLGERSLRKSYYPELQRRLAELEASETALADAGRKWQATFDAISDPICLIDIQGKILQCNRAMASFVIKPVEEIVGNHYWEVVYGTTKPIDACPILRMRKSLRRETQVLALGDRWIEVSVDPILDDSGGLLGAVHILSDITARQQAEEALRATEERLRLKLDSILSPDAAIIDEELSNILDTPAVQALMEEFSKLTNMAMAILDLQGKILVATGWQDICTQFHRVHPQAAQNCTESNLFLVQNLRPGEYAAFKCQNHLWDVATPLFIGEKHVGNIFTGQFLYDDEPLDEQLFIDQAAKYGFDQELYLSALHRVPRISRARVKPLMDFLTKFSALVSKLSFSNLKLAKAMSEQRQIAATLRQSKEHFRRLTKLSPVPALIINRRGDIEYLNDRFLTTFGYNLDDIPNLEAWWRCAYPDEHHRLKGMANWRRAVEKAAREDTDIEPSESRVTCKDGTVRIAEIIGTRIGNKNLVILQDITEHKRAEAEIVRQSGQLRALAARLADVEETGREHLARELHDQVCQSLTALSLTLTLLQTEMPRKAAAKLRGRMAGAVALVDQMGETIRDVMAELRPPMLDDYGLLSALHWYGTEFSDKTGIGVDVQGQEAVPRLAAPVELALFRIVQEAMANVAKHAQASKIFLTEAEDNGTVRLVIADNGVGFDQERLGQPEGRHLWGLMTMSERAAAAGGRCRIESQPGQGTRVVVEVSR